MISVRTAYLGCAVYSIATRLDKHIPTLCRQSYNIKVDNTGNLLICGMKGPLSRDSSHANSRLGEVQIVSKPEWRRTLWMVMINTNVAIL